MSAGCLPKSVVLSCATENKVAFNKQTNHFSLLTLLILAEADEWPRGVLAQGIRGPSFGQEVDGTLQYHSSTVVECHQKRYNKTGGTNLTCRKSYRRSQRIPEELLASCLGVPVENLHLHCILFVHKIKVGTLNLQPQAVSFKGNPLCTSIGMELRTFRSVM